MSDKEIRVYRGECRRRGKRTEKGMREGMRRGKGKGQEIGMGEGKKEGGVGDRGGISWDCFCVSVNAQMDALRR